MTGAANGIGRALAERFAAAGMYVVLADIEGDALDRAVVELQNRQSRVIGGPVNTMERDSVRARAARAAREFGKVHLLCNNKYDRDGLDQGTLRTLEAYPVDFSSRLTVVPRRLAPRFLSRASAGAGARAGPRP